MQLCMNLQAMFVPDMPATAMIINPIPAKYCAVGDMFVSMAIVFCSAGSTLDRKMIAPPEMTAAMKVDVAIVSPKINLKAIALIKGKVHLITSQIVSGM